MKPYEHAVRNGGVYRDALSDDARALAGRLLVEIGEFSREHDGMRTSVALGALCHAINVTIMSQAETLDQCRAFAAHANAKIGLGVARTIEPNADVPAEIVSAARVVW